LVLHRHLRARLRATGRTESPDRVLAHLRRIQEHRLTIGDTAHRTTSRLSELQRELLSQLNLPFPTLPAAVATPKSRSRRQQPSRKAKTKPNNPAKMYVCRAPRKTAVVVANAGVQGLKPLIGKGAGFPHWRE
jgi:hypothetical protein